MLGGKNIIVKVGDDVTLPHNDDIEKDVLGSILILGSESMSEVEEFLSPNAFYSSANKSIYSAIMSLMATRKPIDVYNLAIELKAQGTLDEVGGPMYISSITKNVTSTSFLGQHAKLLRQMEIQRDLFMLAEKAKVMAIDPSIDSQETIETVEKGLTELQMHEKGQALTMTESISQFYEWVRDNADKKNGAISTGLNGLDKILNGGFRSPDLIVIGGRPSMGKTQFAVHFARNAALQGKEVYFVSIEMLAEQLVARMVAKEGLSYSRMRQGTLDTNEWHAMEEVLGDLSYLRMHIADKPECRQLSYIKSEARLLKRKGKLDMMIIDYLGLIRTNQRFEKRYIEVGYITGELKALAKELKIPIILLAQLSRPASGQEKQAPKMEALRESGDIEQDADVIIFPHRPWVYDAQACDETGRSWANRGVLLVEKNREGERNVRTYFANDPQFKDFWDDDTANEQLSKH